MQLNINQITFPPGTKIIINDASWSDYERLMDELGEGSSLRALADKHLDQGLTHK